MCKLRIKEVWNVHCGEVQNLKMSIILLDHNKKILSACYFLQGCLHLNKNELWKEKYNIYISTVPTEPDEGDCLLVWKILKVWEGKCICLWCAPTGPGFSPAPLSVSTWLFCSETRSAQQVHNYNLQNSVSSTTLLQYNHCGSSSLGLTHRQLCAWHFNIFYSLISCK